MAKLVLNDITSGYASVTALNENFTKIENALENTLSRDGTTPNTMSADLDMNGKKILNVSDALIGGVGLAASVTAAASSASAASASASNAATSASAAATSAVNSANSAAIVADWDYVGTWTTSTAYKKNNIVYVSADGGSYIALVDHTSDATAFSTDLGLGRWGKLAEKGDAATAAALSAHEAAADPHPNYALESAVVGLTGDQTIGGTKTFTGNVLVTGNINAASYNGGQLAGMRNKIINGNMEIDQRNAGALVTVNTDAANVYSVDRWAGLATPATGVFTLDQETGPFVATSGRYPAALRVNVTTAMASLAAGDRFSFGQVIEGFNVSDLNYGFSAAREVTLSFEVFSTLAGTYCVSLRNSAENRSYVAEYTVSQANAWERKTITIPGDTAGTWLTDNGVGIRLNWSLGAGPSHQTTARSWQAGNFSATANQVNFMSSNSGRTMFITGVQLEVGPVATPFEHRPYGAELALCQRYFEVSYASIRLALASGTWTGQTPIKWSVAKRAAPTVTGGTTYAAFNIAAGPFFDNPDTGGASLRLTSSAADASWTGQVGAASEL